MDILTQRSALALIRQFYDRKDSIVPRIATAPQKPPCPDPRPVLQAFPRSAPEAQGVASDHLAAFLEALQDDDTLDPHGLLVLRNGFVIAEGGFGAYDPRLWHVTHSACKSITSLAVGMLVDEGRLSLDDRVVTLLEVPAASLARLALRSLTVRHLLTMSSCIVFNELGAVTETDWVKCYLESTVLFEPGSRFLYNSMNSYLLSAIVRRVSGTGLVDFLRPRLWEPLGIEDFFWETCPAGVEKGGWGLYMRPEDLAKVGQLVLQNGRWKDRQLISRGYLAEATSARMETPSALGDYDYGYQIWVGKRTRSFLFNGMLGQNVIGFPDTGILLVSHAGNGEMFQQSRFFRYVDAYFGRQYRPAETALPEDPDAHRRLTSLAASLRRHFPKSVEGWRDRLRSDGGPVAVEDLCASLDGRSYRVDPADGCTTGLLPFIVQVMQNNYTRGVTGFRFSYEDRLLRLAIVEADETYSLPIGFDGPETVDLAFRGEPYRAAVTGRFTRDEDEVPVLIVRVSFLEIASARILRFHFHADRVVVRFTESPGRDFLIGALAAIRSKTKEYSFVDNLVARADGDFIRYKVGRLIEPEVEARPDELGRSFWRG